MLTSESLAAPVAWTLSSGGPIEHIERRASVGVGSSAGNDNADSSNISKLELLIVGSAIGGAYVGYQWGGVLPGALGFFAMPTLTLFGWMLIYGAIHKAV
jgi:hypothetical protein